MLSCHKFPASHRISHQLQPPPDFFDHRIKIFEDLKAEYDALVRGSCASIYPVGRGSLWLVKPRQEITITLPDGAERKGTSWETSPLDVAKEISKSLSERLVIAKVLGPLEIEGHTYWTLNTLVQVNGELWDLERPLEQSVKLELLDFEHPEGMPRPFHPCFINQTLRIREEGVLALFCTRTGGGHRKTLWMSSMSWASDGRRVFL